MKILIETIPHKEQRYNTVGDWQWKTAGETKLSCCKAESHGGNELVLHIRVSQMSELRYEWLVMVHELIEALLCEKAGVTPAQVDEFDTNYSPQVGDPIEPGDDPRAPYHHQHRFATIIEELLAMELGVGWQAYECEVNTL